MEDQILTTRVGLHLPANLTFGGWKQAGHHIARVLDASAWCLGDWLAHGQDRYADRYRQAVATVGLDYAEVASLPAEEQEQWLDRAEHAGWSKTQLRRHIRSNRQEVPAVEIRTSQQLPRIRTTAHRIERWRAAAARSDVALDQWVIATLDLAAAQALEHHAGSLSNAVNG